METFGLLLLKTKDIPASDLSNCEGSDNRTTRHAGYKLSQQKRKRIEEVFGWMKTVAMLRKTRHRGVFQSRMGLHLCGHCLQLGPHAESAVDDSSIRITQGRSVPGRLKTGVRAAIKRPKVIDNSGKANPIPAARTKNLGH